MVITESQYLIGLTRSLELKVWDLVTSRLTCTLNNNPDSIVDLLLIDAKYFISYNLNFNSFKIWNYVNCSFVFNYDLITATLDSLVHIGNGILVMYTSKRDMRVFDVNSLRLKLNFSVSLIDPDYINKGSLYFNEKYLILVNFRTVYQYNITNFVIRGTLTYGLIYYTFYFYNDYYLTIDQNDIWMIGASKSAHDVKLDATKNGHRNKILKGLFFKNSGLFASFGADRLVKIWDLNNFTLRNTFSASFSNKYFITIGNNYFLSYENDGSGGFSQTKIWDVNNLGLVYNFSSHVFYIFETNVDSNFLLSYPTTTSSIQTTTTTKTPIKITNNSTLNNKTYFLVFSAEYNKPKVWSLSDGKLNFTLDVSNPSSWLSTTEKLIVIDNLYLCTFHRNWSIFLWKLKDKSIIANIDNGIDYYETSYQSLEYLGNSILVSSRLKNNWNMYSIRVYNLYNNSLKYEFNSSNGNYFSDPSFTSISNNYLWISSENSLLWDVEKKVYTSLYKKNKDLFQKMIRINQTHFAALVDNNGAFIRIYSILSLNSFVKELSLYDFNIGDGGDVKAIDDKYMAVTFGYYDFSIMILDINSGSKKCFLSVDGHTNFISSIENIGNGFFASGSFDAFVKIWDISKCSLIYTLDNFENNFFGGIYSLCRVRKLVLIDGFYLASMNEPTGVKIWDLNNFTLKYKFDSDNYKTLDVAIYYD